MRYTSMQPKPENRWQALVDIFNTKKAGKIFTRNEVQMYVDYTVDRLSYERMDEYRCILTRAGFLAQVEPGVYRKIKKIPEKLTYYRARQLAYRKHR